MNRDEFIESLRRHIPEEELPSIDDDRLGTFPITNRGIHIWLFLRPLVGSDSIFEALLPCRSRPSGPPVAIDLALWESNYYRYTSRFRHETGRLQIRHVYLRYQGTPHCNSTFEIDDSAILKEGFSSDLVTYPVELMTGNMITLSATDPLCIKRYSCSQQDDFAVGFGQCFGQNWIYVVCLKEPSHPLWSYYEVMQARAPEHAQTMKKARSGGASCEVYISQTHLPRTNRILQISFIMWKSSRMSGVKLEVFRDTSFGNVSGKWTGFDVDVSRFFIVYAQYYHLIGTDIANRERTILAVNGGVS